VSGLQFDLEHDQSALSLVAIIDSAARAAGKSLFQAEITPGRIRFLISGLNASPIPEGTIIRLLANLRSESLNGILPLRFSGAVAADERGEIVGLAARNGSLTVQGTSSQAVRLQPAGVLNAASLLPGPVSPGGIITLIGSGIGPASEVIVQPPGLTTAGETTVHLDGVPAPLLYAAQNQINAIVPYAVQGKVSARLSISRRGTVLASLVVPIFAASPGVFTIGSAGVGQAAALNQDGSINSAANPAARGSIAVLYATGAGQTTPPGLDGQAAVDVLPKPVLPVSVSAGGIPAELIYAGAAPGFVAGVLQINFRIPLGIPAGPYVSVLFTAGASSSQSGVFLAVQ
jgi:uncharacterized protein (TIGR03437 family)